MGARMTDIQDADGKVFTQLVSERLQAGVYVSGRMIGLSSDSVRTE